jgi:hypothetical protein
VPTHRICCDLHAVNARRLGAVFAPRRAIGSVANKTTAMSTTRRGGKSALDEFLAEPVFVRDGDPGQPGVRIDPSEVHLELTTDPSRVQMWPMVAAALVAFGVSLLTFAALAKYTHF